MNLSNKQQKLRELLKEVQRMKAIKDGGSTAGLIYDLVDRMGELKGDKGDTGGIGPTPKKGIDYMTEEEIDHFINKVFLLIRVPEDGKNADEKKMIEEILRRIPRPKDGKDVNEKKIIKEILRKIPIPRDGANGIDGDDGSPDTPKQIAKKLNTLDKVIDAKVIKNLPTVIERRMIPEITLFGGQGRGRTKVQDISAGAGIAIVKSAGGVYKITSTGELENLWDKSNGTIIPHTANDNVDIGSGTIIAGDPTLPAHLTTRSWVEAAIEIPLSYYFTDTESDLDPYAATTYVMNNQVSPDAESTKTIANLSGGDDQLLTVMATPSGEPGLNQLEAGSYDSHVHAEVTVGNRSVNLYWTLTKRTTGGVDTLLMTSELTTSVTAKEDYTTHANIAAEVEMDTTDRIIWKLYANVGTSGSNVTIVLYDEGNYDSHTTVKATSAVFNNIFLRLNGSNADTNIDIGTYDFQTSGTILTGDHGTPATDEVINVCYGTGEPPAVNTVTEGTLFIKYIA